MFFRFLVLYLASLDGVRTAPPVGDGHTDGGKHHPERSIVFQQIMVVVASTNRNRWQVLAYGHLFLEIRSLYLFAKQLIFCSSQ